MYILPVHFHGLLTMAQLLVVVTQRADFLFACPSAAAEFCSAEKQWWYESTGSCFGIFPEQLGSLHRFREEAADHPMEAGPGQGQCRRVRRHVARWWRERDAWYADLP